MDDTTATSFAYSANAIPPLPSQHSHRLPTVSASQALRALQDSGPNYASTGIRSLDTILAGPEDGHRIGGLERGKLTEIWGGSGAGKTAVGLQAAANSIKEGNNVMWIGGNKPLCISRLESLLQASSHTSDSIEECLTRFHFGRTPTLSHLLALILQPRSNFPPPNASLLIIDGLNALIDLDYPRYQFAASNQTESRKWQAGRRYAILGSVVGALNKLALLNNMAVVITTGCATRSRSESGLGSALVPGVGGPEWDSGIWNRLVVFRDFHSRFLGVQKCRGKSLISREEVGEVGRVVNFRFANGGTIKEQEAAKLNGTLISSPVKAPLKQAAKRSFDEIADSEDEDVDEYGWTESDEHALNLDESDHEAQTVDDSAAPD